ncbi:MAG: hypothetical protein CSA62_12640 [Planctomycetota bacterium]|nr:MAG: hypothetical protein CSA62_12640 [Planctomycetota bacterium]
MTRIQAQLLLPLLFLALASCGIAPPFDAKAVAQEWAAFMDRDYVLRPSDRLAISIYTEPIYNQEITISPNGTVSLLRLPDRLKASGMSIAAFRRRVQADYGKILENPEVSVTLLEAAVQSVYVAGEVSGPGVITYQPGMTLTQAIAAAGGLLVTAKWSNVRVLRNRGRSSDKTYPVNSQKIIFEGSPDFLVLPGDVIWCQTSEIADLGNYVDLYIRRLLPFSIGGISIPTSN